MKVFILGGTGFLGYHTALAFLKDGHTVGVFSLSDIPLGNWFPKEIKVEFGDAFAMSQEELQRVFKGYDALVYALGPDDRFTPPAPAYEYFHKYLVEECGKVLCAARKAGVTRCAVLNSYFCSFDRLHPKWNLALHHPYIRCRNEQAQRAILEGETTMDVMILELPYIFGTMPHRIPLWKDVLLERIRKMNPVFFTTGGTTMIAVEHVGEAIAGAILYGKHAEKYPIGDVNMSWKEMLTIMLETMGIKSRSIITVPSFIAALYGKKLQKDDFAAGKESGLDHGKLFKDIQSRFFYLDADETAAVLKYRRGGVKEAIIKTVEACYPKKELL